MAEIVNVFRENLPFLRFIGKKYADFGHWGEWWQHGWFDQLEAAMGGTDKILALWENGGGYAGLERRAAGQPFAYYIGMFVPENTPVPNGFESIDFSGVDLGTCWIYGKENDVHDTSACKTHVEASGMVIFRDNDGAVWAFENCLCPRYTTPDEHGNIIMDYCWFVEK